MILTGAATLQPFVESFRSMALTPSTLLPVLLGIVSNSLWTHLLCDGRDLRAPDGLDRLHHEWNSGAAPAWAL
jgi:hypothetical protein